MAYDRITRRERAETLYKRIKNGPSFTSIALDFDPTEASRQYRLWADSWCLDDLVKLVKELQEDRR